MSAHDLERDTYTHKIVAAGVIGSRSLCGLIAEYAMSNFPVIQPIDRDREIGDQDVMAHGEWIYYMDWRNVLRRRIRDTKSAATKDAVQALGIPEVVVNRKDISHFSILDQDNFLVYSEEVKPSKPSTHLDNLAVTIEHNVRWINRTNAQMANQTRIIACVNVTRPWMCTWMHAMGSARDPFAALTYSESSANSGFSISIIRMSNGEITRFAYSNCQVLHTATDASENHALVTLVHLPSGMDELWWHDTTGERTRCMDLKSSFAAYTSFHMVGSSILWRRPSRLETKALITDRLASHDERYRSYVTLEFPFVAFAGMEHPFQYVALGWQDPFADIQDDEPWSLKAAMLSRDEAQITKSTRRIWIDKITQMS